MSRPAYPSTFNPTVGTRRVGFIYGRVLVRQVEAAEVFVDLQFPLRGLSHLSGYASQPQMTTPEGINCRGYDTLAFRARGGSRPGLRVYIDDRLPHATEDQTQAGLCDVYALLMEGLGFDVACFITLGLHTGVDGNPSRLLVQGLGASSLPMHFLLFGLGPEPLGVPIGEGGYLLQHLNVLINPAGYALIDPYIDNHRGFRRIHPEEPFDPIRLVPVDSGPLADEPWTSQTGTEDAGEPGNFVRTGGSAGGYGGDDRQTPVIIWEDPDDILFSTALSDAQLNATAYDPDDIDEDTGLPEPGAHPLEGEFTYDPPAAFLLALGEDWPLEVVFEPDSDLVYRTTSKTVHIDVVAGMGFVQAEKATLPGTGTGAISLAMPSNVTSGHLLVVFAVTGRFGAGASTTVVVSDTQGNTWTQAGSYLDGGGGGDLYRLSAWHTVATASGPLTISFTPSNAVYRQMMAMQYRGVLDPGGFDAAVATLDTGASDVFPGPYARTTDAVSVALADELVIGCMVAAFIARGLAADAGFNTRMVIEEDENPASGYWNFLLADKFPIAPGTQAVTATHTTLAAQFLSVALSFKKQT